MEDELNKTKNTKPIKLRRQKEELQSKMEELMKELDEGKEERRIDVEEIARDWDTEGSKSVSVPPRKIPLAQSPAELENVNAATQEPMASGSVGYVVGGSSGYNPSISGCLQSEQQMESQQETGQPADRLYYSMGEAAGLLENIPCCPRLDSFDREKTEPYCSPERTEGLPSLLVEVEMGTQDDAKSVASTTASNSAIFPGKRKKDEDPPEDSDNEEETKIARQKLRPRRTKKPAVERENGGRKEMEVQEETEGPMGPPPVPSSGNVSESVTASESEGGAKGYALTRKKNRKGKRTGGPTVESQLREVPGNMDEFPATPASQLGASAIEWLEDLETIRIGSGNMQGGLQSQMKKRVTALKEVVRVLAEKVEDIGDPNYLRRRNAELTAELKVSRKETEKLRRDLSDLKSVVENLQERMRTQESTKIMFDKASSPPTFPDYLGQRGTDMQDMEEMVKRPALGGVAKPIPMPANDVRKMDAKTMEFELANQIKNLRLQMKTLKRDKAQQQEQPQDKETKVSVIGKPKIISNVQIAPPVKEISEHPIIGHSPIVGSSEWIKAQSKKERRKANKAKVAAQQQPSREQSSNRTQTNDARREAGPKDNKSNSRSGNKAGNRRRPPRTAAVAMKALTPGLTYSEIIKQARNNLQLAELGIERTRIRYAANGDAIIEIPGENRNEKADKLRNKLSDILGEHVKVTRPVVKGDLRLSGFDDSVGAAEIAEVIAENGGCSPRDVKIGEIRKLKNNLCTVWLQCPLAAAVKAAGHEKVKIGWTLAKLQLLKARPTRCFKCWKLGHLKNNCESAVDRSFACYRCGMNGHPAKICTSEIRCAICSEAGLPSDHRVGTTACKADEVGRDSKAKNKNSNKAQKVPARRAEDMDAEND